jgi:O-Antigen ligase
MVWLLIGYMFLFIHRPFEVWPLLGDIRLELCYMLVTGAVWILYPDKRWPVNPLHAAILAFAGAILVCWSVSPWSDQTLETVDRYFKLLVFYLLLVTVVHDEKSLRRIILAFLVVMFIYMFHSLWEFHNGRHEYRMSIVRMIAVDKSLGDPNSFGNSVAYSLPFLVPFWVCRPSRPLRAFLAGYLGLASLCIVLTGSRSSFLGLLLFAGLTMWLSRRRFAWVALGCLAAPALWVALPAESQTRFETIIHPEVGPANAQTSAQGRIEGLYTGFRLWDQYPATGCGPGAWLPASHSRLESHNLLGQLVGELGTLGALTFGAVLLCLWLNLRRVNSIYRQHPEWGQDFPRQLARALGVAVLLLLVLGMFAHNLYRFSWVWDAGFVVITLHCVQQRARWQPAWPEGLPAARHDLYGFV